MKERFFQQKPLVWLPSAARSLCQAGVKASWTFGFDVGSGVENDMVVFNGDGWLAEQLCKFVECGDFHRAGTGKLFLHAPDNSFGEFPACF